MSNENHILFLLSSGFPFESSEQHLQAELPYLKKCFEQIYYVTTSSKLNSSQSETHIPVKNTGNANSLLQKLSHGLHLLSNSDFYKEIFYLIRTKSITSYKLKSLVHYYFNSLQIVNVVSAHIERNWEQYQNKKILFYAYWTDEKAIACILLKLKFKNSYSISRAHGWDVYEERHRENYLPWRNFIFSNLDHVFCISKNGFDYLKARYASFNKASVMRLGTKPLEHFESKKNTELFRILSISSVIPLKRVEKIVKVLQLCGNRIPGKIEWIHVGSGADLDKIQNLAHDLLEGKCTYEFKGQLTNDALRKLLSNNYFDMFINVSETEGLPVTIMEAMSAAIPVMATDVGGTSEIVNAQNGWLVHKNISDNDLAELIFDAINLDKVGMERKRKDALTTFNTQFNSDLNHAKFVDFLTSNLMK
ncbi:MAG: glycosyltransferase [Flavobacteriales bacterium]